MAVAGALVFLITKFYDPAARAREKAIAVEIARMVEQQKVTDSLTLIEVEIEDAIMNNELDRARAGFDKLMAQAPNHPRRDFLKDSIDRADELQKLGGQSVPAQAAAPPPPSRPAAAKPRAAERAPARPTQDRKVAARPPDRNVAQRTRTTSREAAHLWHAHRRTTPGESHSARCAHQSAASHDDEHAGRRAHRNIQWPHARSQ